MRKPCTTTPVKYGLLPFKTARVRRKVIFSVCSPGVRRRYPGYDQDQGSPCPSPRARTRTGYLQDQDRAFPGLLPTTTRTGDSSPPKPRPGQGQDMPRVVRVLRSSRTVLLKQVVKMLAYCTISTANKFSES